MTKPFDVPVAMKSLKDDSTLPLHTDVVLSKGGSRPEVIPHENDHPFVQDYYNGIAIEEAERRVKKTIDG